MPFALVQLRGDATLFHFLERFLLGHGDEILQSHDAAGSRLEGLAVGAVDRAERQVLQLGLTADAGFLSGTEELFKMQTLALIDHVKHQVGLQLLGPLLDGGHVGGAIQVGPVGFDQDERRHLFLVALLGHLDDLSAVADLQLPGCLESLDHTGDAVLVGALAVPEVKVDAEAGEVVL